MKDIIAGYRAARAAADQMEIASPDPSDAEIAATLDILRSLEMALVAARASSLRDLLIKLDVADGLIARQNAAAARDAIESIRRDVVGLATVKQ